MNTPFVYVILLTTCSHISGNPINRQVFNAKRQTKADNIKPSYIQDPLNLLHNKLKDVKLLQTKLKDVNIPQKTVKDVIKKFIVGNYDLKQLHKVGNDVFEYIDEKSKLLEDGRKKAKNIIDTGHERISSQNHDRKQTNHFHEKAIETESKKSKTRDKKLERKYNRNNRKKEKHTTETFLTTTSPSESFIVPSNRVPQPLLNAPMHTDGIATTTVTEQNQGIEDVNTPLAQSESSATTPLTLSSSLENGDHKYQTFAKTGSVKTVPEGLNNVDDEPDTSVVATNKHSSIPTHSTTSSSLPSYSSHLLTASSTWIPSLSSSIHLTSSSVISSSSIHITSSISSVSSSSLSKSTKSVMNLHQSPTTASSSSTSSSIFQSLFKSSKPWVYLHPLSLLTMSSSSPSSSTVSILNSSPFMHSSSAKIHSSSSIHLSSSSTKSSSTTTELLHVTSSSQISTEQTSSSSLSSSLP